MKELVLGNSLSSIQTPAIPRSHSFRTSRRTLLKLPKPVSPSTSIGIDVASAMNSSTSRNCVQEASLLSRTPSDAEIDSPDAQMPWKPASSTIFADRPLWASIRNDRSGESRSRLRDWNRLSGAEDGTAADDSVDFSAGFSVAFKLLRNASCLLWNTQEVILTGGQRR